MCKARAVWPASQRHIWPRLEAALRLAWRWRGEEADAAGRLLCTKVHTRGRAPPGVTSAADLS